MARELGPGWKLARHRGGLLEGEAGSTRARQEGLSGGVRDELDEEHAARQAHGCASSVSFGQAPAGVAVASAVEPAPRRQLRARRSSPLRADSIAPAGPDRPAIGRSDPSDAQGSGAKSRGTRHAECRDSHPLSEPACIPRDGRDVCGPTCTRGSPEATRRRGLQTGRRWHRWGRPALQRSSRPAS